MFLAGDIGGTKTRLAFFEIRGRRLQRHGDETYPSRDYDEFAPILKQFLARHPQPADRVCLGIAGPVRQGRVETSNLPWIVDANRLREEAGTGPITLLNDLEANAYGIGALGADDFAVVNPGVPVAGTAALISAGTGLGEAGLYWDGTRHRPFASEGGHADFGPHGPLQAELTAYLAERLGHVSYERILSGPGLENIYHFLHERAGRPDELPDLMQRLGVKDAAAAISMTAVRGESDLCVQALDVFVSVYGAEAGNLALKLLAVGGVYIGGGIAPKILPKLREPAFLEAFVAKGRMRPVLEAIPILVILNEDTALLGAARYAAGLDEVL
jgi:glucokinase